MKHTRFEFLMDLDGGGHYEQIRVSFLSAQPQTICNVSVVSAFVVRLLGSSIATLGKGDTWDTNAGMRIAFDYVLTRFVFPKDFRRNLRRAVQIELAIDRVDRKCVALSRALDRAAAEYRSLVSLKKLSSASVPALRALRPRQVIVKPEGYKNTNSHAILFGYPVVFEDRGPDHGDAQADGDRGDGPVNQTGR